jgi:hypothetical protein
LPGILGVLRRPQTKADLDPTLLAQLAQRSPSSVALSGTPVRSLIRLAQVTPWGAKVFFVPFRPLTREAISKLPTFLRQQAQRNLAREGPGLRLGLFDSAGGGCCVSPAAIEAGRAWLSGGPSPNSLVVPVPDGIVKVKLVLSPTDDLVATVRGNVAAFVSSRPLDGWSEMIWFDASGNVVTRIG